MTIALRAEGIVVQPERLCYTIAYRQRESRLWWRLFHVTQTFSLSRGQQNCFLLEQRQPLDLLSKNPVQRPTEAVYPLY